jgi:hypothetical protein
MPLPAVDGGEDLRRGHRRHRGRGRGQPGRNRAPGDPPPGERSCSKTGRTPT